MRIPFFRISTLFSVTAALLAGTLFAQADNDSDNSIEPSGFCVLSFNILQGGDGEANSSLANNQFGETRIDEIATITIRSQANIVGIQEDASSDVLLDELNRQQAGWNRYGSVYSRFPITPIETSDQAYGITVCRIEVSPAKQIHFVNCHWAPSRYGPEIVQKAMLDGAVSADPGEFAKTIITASEKPEGYRGYEATVRAIELAEAGIPVIVTGDFNEPSHLDWTGRYANEGPDRWVENPTGTPLRFAIPGPGSIRLYKLGLRDAWRTVYPDEVVQPGDTWTPTYPPGTPGRRPPGEQVNDRIDMIWFSETTLVASECHVIGLTVSNRRHDDFATGRPLGFVNSLQQHVVIAVAFRQHCRTNGVDLGYNRIVIN